MQHLNFCSQLERTVEPPLSARQQLIFVVLLTVVLIVAYGGLSISAGGLMEQRNQLQAEQAALADTVANLQARKTKLEQASTVEREVAILKEDITFRRNLLANIDPNSAVLERGFAEHLAGLARQNIQGMWFTEIQLRQGGQELALKGQTRKPEFVPRYIRKLVHEPVFSGHEFRVFRLNVPEQKQHLLEFELRAQEESASPGEKKS